MAIFTRPPDAPDTGAPPAPPAESTNGRPERSGLVRAAGSAARRRWWWLVVAAVVAAGALVAVDASGGAATYPVDAVFATAPGLFPGAAVEVVGVQVGTVSSVRNVGNEVQVRLAIDRGRPVPARATAALVTPELLGEPSIDLAPGYTGGPALRAGAVIPESRTAVPVSTEQLLQQLEKTLKAVNPNAVGDLISNLAKDLTGQGKNLNTLIAGAAGTLQLLATKADDLGQLSGSLAQLTGTLDSRSAQISQLITAYDTVSGVVAQHSTQLGGAITQLSEASTQIVQLLVPNLSAIESDVGTVTTVGRTLDRNLTSVDNIFASATSLFAGAQRAYTATYNWLNLNLQFPPGVTGAVIAGLVRDRLAGVCRRVAANHSSGLSPTQLQTLATCGNPSSSFFDPIVNQIPAVLNAVSSGTLPAPSATPAQALQQGLAQIPGVSPAPQPATGTAAPSGASPTQPATVPAGSGSAPSGSATCLGGVLGGAVTCSPGPSSPTAGSSGTGSGTQPSSGSGGSLGGLLSYDQPATRSSPGPSLTAAAEADLPPLPGSAPGAAPPAPGHHAPGHHAPGHHAAGHHAAGHHAGARTTASHRPTAGSTRP